MAPPSTSPSAPDPPPAGFISYALVGGADFGGGIWTALSFGPRAPQQRDALFNAIGPVWETKHALILIPSLSYLYWTFRGELDTEIPPAGNEQ